MSDDLLARATRALREETGAASDASDGSLTLARVERSLRDDDDGAASSRSRAGAGSGAGSRGGSGPGAGSRAGAVSGSRARRRFTRLVIMPIAAMFVVVAAWASASGRMGQWLRGGKTAMEEERTGAGEEEGGNKNQAGASSGGYVPASSSAAPSASASASAFASAPASALASASALAPASAPTLAPQKTGDAARAAAGGEAQADSLYRAAHEAHFARHDYRAAVAAWDHYLAAAGPGGRFTLEARYNRGVALLKSGRTSEARAALQPFADGEYGGYRRDEARALLLSLD